MTERSIFPPGTDKFWTGKIASKPLRQALSELDPVAQITLYLRFWEANTIEEIADQLSLTWSKVDQKIDHALKVLRQKICAGSLQGEKDKPF